MFPANKISGTLIHLIYPILLSIVSLFVAFLIGDTLGFQNSEWVIIYLALYYCAYFIPMMIPNKHNVNDNTSGVATVMSIARMVNNDKVAFILFDNEEKGLLGSKTFNKKHSEVLKDKLIVNFDCVGNGDQIIFAYKENAEKLYEYDLLCKSLIPSGKFDVHYLPAKKCLGNSDYKSFLNGVGVMACKRGKLFKFYTDRIHTSKDTVADEENILFLAERMICLLEKL